MTARLLAVALLVAGCGAEQPEGSDPLSRLPDVAGPLDALNRRHNQLRRRLRRRGYATQVGLTRTFLLEEDGRALPLDLAVDRCSTFVGLAGGQLRDLAMTLYDGAGDEVAIDPVPAEGALLHVCPQADGDSAHRPYYLMVRSREGSGAVLITHVESAPDEGEGFDGLFDGVLAPRVPFREVEERLARTRRSLRARGFARLDEPRMERVAEGGLLRMSVRLSEEHCYVAVGRGGSGVADVDLSLFDAAGAEVARDLGGDAEPSLEHCPERAGRYSFELRAFEGAGAVGLGVFEGPRSPTAQDVDALEDDPVDAERADPSLALGVLAAPLQRRQFDPPLYVSQDAAIRPGEVRTHEVVVGPGCVLIAGAASASGVDLDLYLADGSGREIDRDTAVASTARGRVCRAEPEVVRVAVKAYGREGTYALAVLRAPPTVETVRDLRMEEATASFRLRGYDEAEVLSWDLDAAATRQHAVRLSAGACLAVAVAGDEAVRDVDLFLRGADGALLASDAGSAPLAVVSRCAVEDETLGIDVTAAQGQGAVTLVVLETPAEPDEP